MTRSIESDADVNGGGSRSLEGEIVEDDFENEDEGSGDGREQRAAIAHDEIIESGPTEDDRIFAESDDDAIDSDADADEDDGEIIDADQTGLARRNAITLAKQKGEWVKGKRSAAGEGSRQLGDLYRAFVREATRYQRLSEEEERALGERVQKHGDSDAAKKLVVHNLRLALKMAHQYRRSWTNLMDLVQEASAGMAIASQRWDPDQGTRFGTYAVYWMRAQLTKFLMTNGRMIHTGNTRAGRKLYYQLPRIRRQLLADGKNPTPELIAAEVGEKVEEVNRILARLDGREASLNAPVGDEDSGTLGDMIEGDDAGPESNAAQNEMGVLINGLMTRFRETIADERDLAIWDQHLTSTEPASLVELGKHYGVSKQRMGQLATRLKRKFRRHVIDELGPETQLSWLFNQD